MPLFNYICLECDEIIEKFQNKPDKTKIECKECGNDKFERIFGKVRSKVRYNARDTLINKIKPDAVRINKNIAKGKDKDFLDISGE